MINYNLINQILKNKQGCNIQSNSYREDQSTTTKPELVTGTKTLNCPLYNRTIIKAKSKLENFLSHKLSQNIRLVTSRCHGHTPTTEISNGMTA